ncbi:MAG: sigma-70 family RNA polymerase sigma factor [Isosphaeraceae bacterium]
MAGGRVHFRGGRRDVETLFAGGAVGGLADATLLERFARSGDAAAFAALVDRHGPAVLSACRAVLGHHGPDVEDAFQATFLVLARKAGSLRNAGSLGGWLHRVARRVALQALADAARRRERERRAAVPECQPGPESERTHWDDALPLLHEEIDRLPEKYRAPVVLCELESLTRDQAATRLGWPAGTVAGRLARGRDILRDRLVRRGVAPAALASALLAAREAGAAVPELWAASATAAAVGAASLSGTLATEVLNAMLRSKIRRAATAALTIGLTLGLALAVLARPRDDAPKIPPNDQQASKPGPTAPVVGSVIGPDGLPAEGVTVLASLRDVGGIWGRVVAETRTDDQGRFRLEFPADHFRKDFLPGGAIWAYRPGSLVGSYPVHQGNVHSDVSLRLAVGPASTATVEVRDPEGKPVAGAHVTPRVLVRDYLSVPDGLAERIAAEAVTDARGRATIQAFQPEEISTILVQAPGFGTQQFGFGHRGKEVGVGVKVVHLVRTGRVEGRLVGPPEAVGGVPLDVMVWNNNTDPAPPPAIGLLRLKTEADGRFVIPEAPQGKLSANQAGGLRRYVAAPPDGVEVRAGKTTTAELKLLDAVAVHGAVREKETGKPVPGVEFTAFRGEEVARTDAEGRFTLYLQPGRALIHLRRIPPGHAGLLYGVPDVRIPEGVAEHVLPDIELSAARDRKGRVVDVRDQPVPGAQVDASWPVDEGPNRRGQREMSVTADGRGEFVLADVPEGANVRLSARAGSVGRTEGTVTAPAGDATITLRLEDARLVRMRGRVVDAERKPVAGARVRLRKQERYDSGQIRGDVAVEFPGLPIIQTDADGRFQTVRSLDPEAEYAVIAEADGFPPVQSPWTAAQAGMFPDLVLTAGSGRNRK